MYKKFEGELLLMYFFRPVTFAEENSVFFLSSLSILISNLPSSLSFLHKLSFPTGKNLQQPFFCDCFVTNAVIECAYDWKNL